MAHERELPPRRLLVLVNKPSGIAPSQRFRLEQWAPRLERDHDICLTFLPFESPGLTKVLYQRGRFASKGFRISYDFLRRFGAVIAARRFDAVVIHREAALIGPAVYERLIAWTGTPIIFDFDDAIWMQQPEARNSIFSRLHFHSKTATLCRLATAVSAGNDYLAAYARRWNENVHIVPTSIEMAEYGNVPESPERPFIVCWTGSTTTLPHFEQAREALEIVATRLPLIVKIICNTPLTSPVEGASNQFIPWSPAVEAEEIAKSHVGIMPLPDNAFSRGKCGLKALQCMAAARPVVISPVGVNSEIVSDGRNGLLASTTQDYVEALMRLADLPDLRRSLGQEAKRTIEGHFSAEVVAARFARLVRSVTD